MVMSISFSKTTIFIVYKGENGGERGIDQNRLGPVLTLRASPPSAARFNLLAQIVEL